MSNPEIPNPEIDMTIVDKPESSPSKEIGIRNPVRSMEIKGGLKNSSRNGMYTSTSTRMYTRQTN